MMILFQLKEKINIIELKLFKKWLKNIFLRNVIAKKNNKICNWNHKKLIKFKNAYNSSDEEGNALIIQNIDFFETMFNVSLSITNSFKCLAGKDFEHCIEHALIKANLVKNKHFCSQIFISNEKIFKHNFLMKKNKGFIIDMCIPPPLDNSNLQNYNGFIISMKTTTRERYHQDKFLGKFVLITLDNFKTNDENITVVRIQKNKNELTNFIENIIIPFLNL